MGSWAQSCSSVMRSIWDTRFRTCCRSEDDERSVEIMITYGELVEVQPVEKENKNIDEAQTKEGGAESDAMTAIMIENLALKTALIIEKQDLEQQIISYGKQHELDTKLIKEHTERANAEEREKNKAFEDVAAQQNAYDNLHQAYEDLGERYKKLFKNPCSCFYAKNAEEILFQRYNSEEDSPPFIEEGKCTADLVPKEINDISGFLPLDDDNSYYLYSASEVSDAGEEINERDEGQNENTGSNEAEADAPAGKDEELWWLPEDLR